MAEAQRGLAYSRRFAHFEVHWMADSRSRCRSYFGQISQATLLGHGSGLLLSASWPLNYRQKMTC
ncbi:hypothetical protein [Janthinobacterium sp.]|uniref:hypothetical protein n=1 Tax=Janthinobacterium sp. TaxID=1871054 RepID=UPI00289AA8B3|nr:hypothetical protein [Janthinobacterium sp.]